MQYISPDISYRLAQMSDCMTYFKWANDQTVRKNAFHSEPVEWESHQKWFSKKIHSDDTVLLVFYKSGETFGQLRLDIEGSEGVIDFSISSEFRGMNLAFQILLIIDELMRKFKTIHTLTGVVKDNNIASLKSFEKAGFMVIHRKIINDSPCIIFKKNIVV